MKTILSKFSSWQRLPHAYLLCCATLVGCGSAPVTNPNLDGKPPAMPAHAQLLIVQATADVPVLDVWVDGEPRITALATRHGSPFVSLAPGTHKLDLRLPTAAATEPPLWSGGIYLQPGQRVLACALGRAADSTQSSSPTRLNVIAEPLGEAVRDQRPLRILHATPSLGSLDVMDAAQPGASLWPALRFGHFSGYVDVATETGSPRTELRLGLRAAGEAFDLASLIAKNDQLASVGSAAQTAILLGDTTPLPGPAGFLGALLLDETTGTLRELALEPNATGPKATLYVLHASPDVGAIDVYSKINGARLVGSLDYRQATSLLQLVPTSYPIEVRPASLPKVLLRTDLHLLPNQHWAVYLGGRQDGESSTLRLVALPRTQGNGTQTLRRAVHAIADARSDSRMTLVTTGGPSFVDPVPFAAASPYRSGELQAEPLRLGLSGSKQTWEVDMPQPMVDAAAKGVLAVYATGTLTDPRAPLTALAVLESSATATQAALVIALRTTLQPNP